MMNNDDDDIDGVRKMIDEAVMLTSSAQRDVTQFKEYVSNAPTPQDAMNRQQMLNKFTNNVSNVAKQLEDVIKRYANIKKNTTGKNDWIQYGKDEVIIIIIDIIS
ncbi:hypothetical protein Pmar_PMAR010027 [Perkinsus marinus ATCC 50983]|uniref:Uncharacterized protein n=1 Tax=Perkinsus marinus (strain ATCC 50983 / TXsc) TaxID=423536 RepID=C5KW22_PERM5|nr:hypothetical protein Pmar_PMAR010027 [Perkinsus marinus ATCC 50983]EER11321.1 hypothetical protein Pmar_PMAR010027 [Perkinsus marinus ATCC 50983]|eukprot:XP_002779526.1 hypothetical protein Pmar_PMAR010027 [Perkinsus marinus ATCC 50983]